MSHDLLKRIYPTGHVQWDIYNIVKLAFCPFRGIKLTTPDISHVDLIKNMQFDMFIKLQGTDRDGKKIIISILNKNEKGSSEIATMTEKFRLFINSIKESDANIILISPVHFQTHVVNFINEQSGLSTRLFRYSYDHFKTVVPLGPYCSKHSIISAADAKVICEAIGVEPKKLKKILSYDPQMVWLGAQPTDIILIERVNPLSGRSIDLRRVIKGEPF